MAEKKKKHHFSHTHIEHHDDGSATVHHQHESDPKKDIKHAVADTDQMHDSLEDHIGTPNAGEAAANVGDHGVAEPAASAAGLPAPGMAGGAPGGM
jgi:hypothetical protein